MSEVLEKSMTLTQLDLGGDDVVGGKLNQNMKRKFNLLIDEGNEKEIILRLKEQEG